jgi:hypothetical protein
MSLYELLTHKYKLTISFAGLLLSLLLASRAFQLPLPLICVATTEPHELIVTALLYRSSLLEHNNRVRILVRGT